MNQQSKVAVIGAGVMGEALIAALISSGVNPDRITISEKREERVQELIAKYSINSADIAHNVAYADARLLVVKPQDMATVLEEIKGSINPKAVVITFAAGKTISFISNGLGTSNPVIRVMPNTPMSVGVGASAISKGSSATQADVKVVEDMLKASGKTIYVDEKLQDAVTATSGSGPAYFFRFVEAMILAAQELGLAESDAKTLVIQTIAGASEMLKQDGASPKTLRENVTSPNGTTFAALEVFEKEDLSGMVKKAMLAARDRSQELS